MKRPLCYYFWHYSEELGWRQMGKQDGYDTLTELRKDLKKDYKNEAYLIVGGFHIYKRL